MGVETDVDLETQISAATEFVTRWQNKGKERSDAQAFWLDLLGSVYGIEHPASFCRFEERTAVNGLIDVMIPEAKVLVEQKSVGVDLDTPAVRQGRRVTPYQQAKFYADSLPNTERPDRIIVCNFKEFRIHDLNSTRPEKEYISIQLADLPDQVALFNFLVDPGSSRRAKEEQVSIKAGNLIGKLHAGLIDRLDYTLDNEGRHNLSVLCVRIVFCLFAEDSGIFEKDSFGAYIDQFEPEYVNVGLDKLFEVLNTPAGPKRKNLGDTLSAFPYVNGGLFAGEVDIPTFDEPLKRLLVDELSLGMNWSTISPTIFGAVFEATLNPSIRHERGMHFTSLQNIHRVIDPLFLNKLTSELEEILTNSARSKGSRTQRLNNFRKRLSKLQFLDPAAGSGNFLTESYICLRRLENRVLAVLKEDQTWMEFTSDNDLVLISLEQFHGIEINDFAVQVARTALWIAEIQADSETRFIADRVVDSLPLTTSANIHLGNALTEDWNDVIPSSSCNYIFGNPPFLGARNQSREQKQEIQDIFAESKHAGNLDYVAGWFLKAAGYLSSPNQSVAFVATSSICQGEQVATVWEPIFKRRCSIDFAHDSFRWRTESNDAAHVFCVIVGFSRRRNKEAILFHHPKPDSEEIVSTVSRLNPYLVDGPNVYIWNRRQGPLFDVPKMGIGSQPIDNGNYLFDADGLAHFLDLEPAASDYVFEWLGAKEFISGDSRWVLDLCNIESSALLGMPFCLKRVEAVREFRLRSKRSQTRKAASTPQCLGTYIPRKGNAVIIPEVSSEAREYVPMGFVGPEVRCSNTVRLIPDATLYHFGILQSSTHNAWIRSVGGKLEGRIRYSAGVVYNNFPWPEVSQDVKEAISERSRDVLAARKSYSDHPLSVLYNPSVSFLFPRLWEAHRQLDIAVLDAYGLRPALSEPEITAALMLLYAELRRKA